MPSIPDSRAAPSKESWIFHQSHSLGTRPNSNATVPSPAETPDYLLKVLTIEFLKQRGWRLGLWEWQKAGPHGWPGGSGKAQSRGPHCLRQLSLLPHP